MCSKKVAGVALIVTGVVFIALGIMVGMLLPKVAHNTVEDQTCVNNKDSPGYARWVGPTEFTTKAYIWNITNKDGFLYRGEKPKLEEKGPYVYSTKSKKVNIQFEKGRVTSTSFDQAKFNKTLTEKECPACTEHDELTVLNIAYLGLMTTVPSAKDFSTAFIPLVLGLLFHGLDNTTGSRNATLIQMGQAQNLLGLSSSSANPAFGAWFNSNPLFSPFHRNFTQKEMSGLYGALMDPSKFGPFTNTTLLAQCLNPSLSSPPSKDCGLAINLGIYSQYPQFSEGVRPLIASLLCPDPLSSCFNTTNNATIKAIALFITDPLPKFVLGYLESNNYGLTTTRKQSEITLGYVMNRLPLPPKYPSGIPVPGSVTSHVDEEQAKKLEKNSTFYTCGSTEEDRFTYAAIGGESKVKKDLYPNASPEERKVRGYYVQFPGRKSLKPCTTKYTQQVSSYELFFSQFGFAVPVTYNEDVEIHDIPMHKYVLKKAALATNNVTIFTPGVFDVTRVLQGPLYISLPGFLYGEPSLYNELNLTEPNVEKYQSFLSIEPISGTAMDLKLRVQLNGVILNTSLSSDHQQHLNVSYMNKLIPVSWSETAASIDAETAKEYSSKLFESLRLSCGLLVALPVIGGLFLVVGVALIVVAVKKGSSVTTA